MTTEEKPKEMPEKRIVNTAKVDMPAAVTIPVLTIPAVNPVLGPAAMPVEVPAVVPVAGPALGPVEVPAAGSADQAVAAVPTIPTVQAPSSTRSVESKLHQALEDVETRSGLVRVFVNSLN